MTKYRLSNEAKIDLIQIHHYGVKKFGMTQADKYFESFFKNFELIAQRPLAFKSVDEISKGCRCCPCGSDSIYYTLIEGTVEIVAIVGSQDLENMFS